MDTGTRAMGWVIRATVVCTDDRYGLLAAGTCGRGTDVSRYTIVKNSNTVWIAIVSMALILSFSKVVDSEGQVMKPSGNYTSGFMW